MKTSKEFLKLYADLCATCRQVGIYPVIKYKPRLRRAGSLRGFALYKVINQQEREVTLNASKEKTSSEKSTS